LNIHTVLRIFILILTLLSTKVVAQDYFAYGSSNFAGVQSVLSNPANAADNRLKFDLLLGGADFNFNNSWFGVKRDALKLSGANSALPDSWQNTTPNVPNNIFKNFHFISSKKSRSLNIENRILLPSFLIQLNSKNAIAFNWSVRQFTNMDGMSPQLSYLAEKEMDLNVTQNNRVQNKNFAFVQMSWAEYGMTYARVLSQKPKHFFKGGVSGKILQGLESAYLIVNNLDFLFSTKDASSYFNSNFDYATSANLQSNSFDDKKPVGSFYHYVTKPALGLDLGVVYEWRPNYQDYKVKSDEKHFGLRKDVNKYKIKFGASINDIGRIKFQKVGNYYDLNVALNKDNLTTYTDVSSTKMFDSLLKANFSKQNVDKEFRILLPTAINTQMDVALNKFFYLNLSTHLSNLFRNNLYKVHNNTAFCFAPRFESYWFDLSIPFTYNTLSAKRYKEIMTGLNVKIGPVSFGSNDLLPLFNGSDVRAVNFYALLKLSIPYKQDRDKDKDGIKDKDDACPETFGEAAYNGCPDSDHDKVPDKDDACPNQAGLVNFKGCPDTDGDGVKDSEDECPKVKGPLYLHGCPDLDHDSIPDQNDSCPNIAGRRINKGCPDSDRDGIWDKYDDCPKAYGPYKYKGCPDRDNDGIIDKLDACVNVPGVAKYKGCPPPPPVELEAKEKRILEKAYSSLEFATGKEIIKASSFPSLNALANLLMDHDGDWKLKLGGHTDSEGSSKQNLLLSEKRAKAVQKYLIKKGVSPESIIAEWYGETKNIADNSTKAGKQKNRRVDMTILATE
jgi:outer membrane protein OmpA-like peptidoglycan-associated protein